MWPSIQKSELSRVRRIDATQLAPSSRGQQIEKPSRPNNTKRYSVKFAVTKKIKINPAPRENDTIKI